MAKSKKKLKLKILIIALYIIAVGSLTMLLIYAIRYRNSRDAYEELESDAITTVETVEADGTAETAESEPAVNESPEISTSVSREINVTADWEYLKKTDHYVKGWLYGPDIGLSYPVVQYKNNEYFLTRNFERKNDEAGTLFFDYRNEMGMGLENWILYGHRRNDGSMFGNLKRYGREEYYLKHPVIYLLTPNQNYRIELFSCRTVQAAADPKYYTLFFASKEEMEKYILKAKQQSYWESIYDEGTDYPLITLSTCTTYGDKEENRLLLTGWLVPID